LIASTPSTAYTDTAVLPSSTYFYSIVGYDKWGTKSALSAASAVRTP
jgi:fibronectin type 3 domain-containing protein